MGEGTPAGGAAEVDPSTDGAAEQDLPLLALLQRSLRACQEEFLGRIEQAGVASITPAHTMVLAHLRTGQPLSTAELARRAGVTRQTMHRSVTQLVEEGLLTSTPGSGFPRSTGITLTEAGRARRDVALGALEDMESAIGERLGEDELAALRRALLRAWP